MQGTDVVVARHPRKPYVDYSQTSWITEVEIHGDSESLEQAVSSTSCIST